MDGARTTCATRMAVYDRSVSVGDATTKWEARTLLPLAGGDVEGRAEAFGERVASGADDANVPCDIE